MSEFTSKIIQNIIPALGTTPVQVLYVKGVSGANSDTITVAGLTTVVGAILTSTVGTAGTMTFSTNVITVTNGGTGTWSGLAWGNP